MPPKSKKEVATHQKKVIEDKTFGLKNKNRSSKVQQMVQQFTNSVVAGSREQQKKQAEMNQKKSAKEAKLEYEAEMARLFKVAEDKKKNDEDEAARRKAAGEDEDYDVNPEDYLWRPEDFEGVAEDNTRLEEKLELEREALRERTDLTPVTEASFRAWRDKKIREKKEEELNRLKKAKEGGGKGMRGWDLWQENADLFVDDDEAVNEYERELEEAELEAMRPPDDE
jgi:hypothetical protein